MSTTDWLEDLHAQRAVVGRTSTAGRVADLLRAQITEGRLRPGTRLSEEDLGAALGVSRNTLREAFRLLSHERLLVHEFNRGVFVRLLNAADVQDLYAVRKIVECGALRRTAERSGDGGVPGAALLAPIRAAVAEGSMIAAVEEYLALRRAAGYSVRDADRILRSFGRFAHARRDRFVKVATIHAWAKRARSPERREALVRKVALLARHLGTANMHFHPAIAGLAESPRLSELMSQVLAELRLVFHVMEAPQRFHQTYLGENRAILTLLEAGRFAEAEAALAAYLDKAEAQLVEAYG